MEEKTFSVGENREVVVGSMEMEEEKMGETLVEVGMVEKVGKVGEEKEEEMVEGQMDTEMEAFVPGFVGQV